MNKIIKRFNTYIISDLNMEMEHIIFYDSNGVVLSLAPSEYDTVTLTYKTDGTTDIASYTGLCDLRIGELARKTKVDYSCHKNFYIRLKKNPYDLYNIGELYIYIDNKYLSIKHKEKALNTEHKMELETITETFDLWQLSGMSLYEPLMFKTLEDRKSVRTKLGKRLDKVKKVIGNEFYVDEYTLRELLKLFDMTPIKE